ncbi:MAG: DUF373 family protein [Candidatus Methanomethylophilaceae archaeon]|nr:DUF373 family protein [Candidatus Methanomethylophilaceae archaeon]
MTKTLVLVVDRDDDYGEKGGVETPLIGIDKATEAAIALGVADPEDSDVNALFAAMNIYKELSEEGKDVEIALVCGDKKVGYKSDSALIDELNQVIDEVKPDRSILVGDGAEDEFVYPIISSRVPVDSVRKVYVKQTPNIEGSLYIFSKMLADPQKRKRFLAPIGVILLAIAMVYIIVDIYAFAITDSTGYLISMSAPIVVFLIGLLITLYGYNSTDRIIGFIDEWKDQMRDSKVSLTFTVLAFAMVVVGVIFGIYAIKNITTNGFIYVALVFLSNIVWPFSFAFFFNELGHMLDEYVEKRHLEDHFMTGSISVFGIAFIIQGAIDFTRKFIGYGTYENSMIFIELVLGILLMLFASIIHISISRYFLYHGEVAENEE